MVSVEPADLQFIEADLNDPNRFDTSTNTPVAEGFVESETDSAILLAQAVGNTAFVTDQPNPVLAQLAQNTSPNPTTSSDAKPAAKAASLTDADGFSWPLVGGALAGLALLSSGGSGSSEILPTNAPTSAPTEAPTTAPTVAPTSAPTEAPTSAPVDSKSPTATISIADTILTAGEQTTITVTFNELVKNFELSDLTAPNGVLSDLVQSSQNPLVWTAKFVPAASTEDLTNAVTLSGTYDDLAGNAGSASISDNYIVATQLDGGSLADGYIAGATVFRDLDGDGTLDDGENSVTTGADGTFTGLGGYGGTIIALSGTDISTGLKFAGVLKAPDGSAVINPLTTLVSALTGDTSGMSTVEIAEAIAAAEDKVASLLGIDPDLGSITQIDPLALIATGGPDEADALQMQLQALQVANVLVALTQSIVNSGVAVDMNAASLLISDALVVMINDASEAGALDLTDPSVINGLFSSVVSAATASGSVSASALASLENVAAQASAALAAVNGKIDEIDPDSGILGLKTAVAAQLVIVGEDGLLNALSTGQDFSTDNLDLLIFNNLDDVKDVVRPTDAPTSAPTDAPTSAPTSAPTDAPTSAPTSAPTDAPTSAPTSAPTDAPTSAPNGIWDVKDANDPDRPDGITVDGRTYTLNTSLAALADSGIQTVTNNGSAVTLIASGYGSSTPITDLVFDENSLLVTVNLTTSDDDLDGSSDGTVNLNTSLSALSAMGIDTIAIASNSGVDSLNVLGYGSAGAISGIVFAPAPDVNLQLTDADDALDNGESLTDGTVNLNTSLSALSNMGIDSIEADSGSSVNSVNVLGYGVNHNITGLEFADALDVTLQLTAFDDAMAVDSVTTDGTVNLNISLSALSTMGIDSVEADSGGGVDAVNVMGYGSDTEISGMEFADALNVSLQLTDADDALDAGANATDTTDGTVNLNTSLSALSAMGIDSIEADSGGGVDAVNVMGYGSDTEISGLEFAGALDVNLQLTDADDALDAGANATDTTDGTVNLNTSLSALSAMGIDSIDADSDGGVGSVIISGGFGDFTLSELSSLGLSFDQDLTVTVDSYDLSSLGLTTDVESSLMLGSGEAAETLRDMGIDIINVDGDDIDLWT
jgi:hypothetical protein